jgi:mono/diheme cytochrome c family protein
MGLWAALVFQTACGSPAASAAPDVGLRYLDDGAFRRAELVASLVNPSNGYSALRLAHYATGDATDWDRLPEWNPPVAPVEAAELDAPGGASSGALSPDASRLVLPADVRSLDDPALMALGKAAFERYPTQPAQYLGLALASRDTASRYGLWVDALRGVGGLVRARMADGSVVLSLTCSTCHAAPAPGGIEAGRPNASLQLGAAILAAEGLANAPPSVDAIAAWGPGRLDVTTAAGTEPARIPDLRPVGFLTYLQQDATVRAPDAAVLAIRVETLIITSNEATLRPPRVVALALAAYVRSLAAGLPSMDAATAASPRGADLFAAQCAGCHAPPALTGEPVALSAIGTDPTLGLSADRGTGMYRVPSLHGVATRGPLLHDGTLPSVDAMFDPERLDTGFPAVLHGAAPIPGHTLGLDLGAGDRQALLAFLHAL